MEPTSHNGPNSAHTSRSEVSGEDYLTQQIADARLALESTLDDLTLDLAKAADLRRWVQRYPWPALGVAVVAGFTAAHFLTSKSRRNDADLTMTDAGDSEHGGTAPPSHAKSHKETHTGNSSDGWRSAMIAGLYDILRLAVTQFVAASLRQPSRQPTGTPLPEQNQSSANAEQRADAGTDISTACGE